MERTRQWKHGLKMWEWHQHHI